MSARYTLAPSWSGTARGLLYGRSRELLATGSLVRVALFAAAMTGVMSLTELNPHGGG